MSEFFRAKLITNLMVEGVLMAEQGKIDKYGPVEPLATVEAANSNDGGFVPSWKRCTRSRPWVLRRQPQPNDRRCDQDAVVIDRINGLDLAVVNLVNRVGYAHLSGVILQNFPRLADLAYL